MKGGTLGDIVETSGGWFRRYVAFVVSVPIPIFVATLLVSEYLLTRIGTLQLDMDPDLWTPQSHP